MPVADIFKRMSTIDSDVEDHINGHVWHNLKKSGEMYHRAFGIEFPPVPEVISQAIFERHDIVHRNGKTKDGKEGEWNFQKILILSEAVSGFASEIDTTIKNLPSLDPPGEISES